jgi:prepilin-type N-terminal cleavage/methylation domain-containing protein
MMSARQQRGFTLIEVMVAAALLATVIAGLARLIAVSAHSARTSDDMTRASYILHDRIEEISTLGAANLVAGAVCSGAAPTCRGVASGSFGPSVAPCEQWVESPVSVTAPSPGGAFRIDTGIEPHTSPNHPDALVATVSVCWRDGSVVREIQTVRVVGDR